MLKTHRNVTVVAVTVMIADLAVEAVQSMEDMVEASVEASAEDVEAEDVEADSEADSGEATSEVAISAVVVAVVIVVLGTSTAVSVTSIPHTCHRTHHPSTWAPTPHQST